MSLQKEKYIILYVYQNLSRLSLRLRIMTGLFFYDNFQNIQKGDCMMTRFNKSIRNSKRIDKLKIHKKEKQENNEKLKIRLKNAKSEGAIVKDFFDEEKLLNEMKVKLTFTSEEEVIAKKKLESLNYYRFSIYPKILPKNDSENFSFNDAMKLYEFDEFLKKNLYEFTSYLENKWKGSLVHYLGVNYNNPHFFMAQCYLDLSLYQSPKWGRDIILTFQDIIKKSNSLPIKHHRKNKQSFIPIWVLIEELTFGQFETFLTQLNGNYLKDFSRGLYNAKYVSAFSGWVSLIRELRNKISHHSRLYGGNFTKPPKILNEDSKKYFPNIKTEPKIRNKLVTTFYVIYKLFIFEDNKMKMKWNTFLYNLDSEINKLSYILDIEKFIGFTPNWLELHTISLKDSSLE